MTTPTRTVRGLTYLRDGHRCVSCGAYAPLEWHHREASGHGGRGRKAPALTPADGLTACSRCNSGFEAELQEVALALGWKLRRNRGGMAAHDIPYFDRNVRGYFLPLVDGTRKPITHSFAVELLEAAGNLRRKVG